MDSEPKQPLITRPNKRVHISTLLEKQTSISREKEGVYIHIKEKIENFGFNVWTWIGLCWVTGLT